MKVNIDGWKAHICFSSAHIIPGHGKCGYLHGHTYAIHASIEGDMDETGILMDFGELKDTLRAISEKLDHRLLVPKKLLTEQKNQQVILTAGTKTYILPKADCLFLPLDAITAENLAQYVLDELFQMYDFPAHIHTVSIGIDEGMGQGAWTQKRE